MKKCERCNKPGTFYTNWDWMCMSCRHKQTFIRGDSLQGEWSRAAKTELNAHIDDVQQPLRKDGTINPHFVHIHGTKSIEKEMKIPKERIRESLAKYG
jgi:hypothetical protein